MQTAPRETKDDGFKTILGNHELFVQFLSDFVKIDIFKDVTPEDIEDITERFTVMGIDSKDGDTVKKINLKNKEPLYVIGIAEHQQSVNHRMSFRFLQYSVFIWLDYEKEQNALHKGISELKDFKYPPILPMVYYTGESSWTSPINFFDKVYFNGIFERYIPKFEYLLIDSKNYTQQDLLKNKDILSLFLIIDKIKRAEQISTLKNIPQSFFDELEANTPEHLKKLVREVVAMFLTKLDIPEQEKDEVIEKIMARRFSEMFTLVDGYSVTETRRIAKEEQKIETQKETRKEVQEEFAKKLLKRKRPIDEIVEDTGLTREEIKNLQNTD